MEDVVIIAGVVLLVLWCQKKTPLVPTSTPAPPVAKGIPISVGPRRYTSGGYAIAPASTQFFNGSGRSPFTLPSVPAPPPVQPPPPPFWGGRAGTVGSGGNGLGGPLRAGVSVGTGTTNPNAGVNFRVRLAS
jgi:hypothetical protein